MRATYWQKGDTLDYRNNNSSKIEAGTVLVLGKHIGVAGTDIDINAVGSINVTGVYEMSKAAGAIEIGEDLYYDSENDVVTATKTEIVAGFAAETKDSSDLKILVRIG